MREFFLALSIGSAALCFAADQSVLLWYREPAEKRVEALPIGNGRLGAMVFGKIADERIQLNEDTVWPGERRDRNNPAARKAVPEIRRLLFEGKVAEAEAMADKDTPKGQQVAAIRQGAGKVAMKSETDGRVSFDTQAGKSYQLMFR
jgi:alpha-L-fucosidase 2